jgi:hypothetical protein
MDRLLRMLNDAVEEHSADEPDELSGEGDLESEEAGGQPVTVNEFHNHGVVVIQNNHYYR